MLLLIPDLAAIPENRTEEALSAMRDAPGAAREFEAGEFEGGEGGEGGDADPAGRGLAAKDSAFLAAIARLAAVPDARNPTITGAVLALATQAGPGAGATLVRAVRGALGGVALAGKERVALLRGALACAPTALWTVPGLLDAVDEVLRGFDEATFMAALPDMRAAFTALNPRETDRVAALLAERHGGGARRLTQSSGHTIEEAAEAARIEAALEAALRADGLGDWLGSDAA